MSLFSAKAKAWVVGRKNWKNKLETVSWADKKVLWMHCASLGEFEQGQPVLAKFREEYPDLYILLTFFSPSGYDARKNTELADYVMYLPIDTQANARFFMQTIQPQIAIFVKYEFWFNYLNTLHNNQVHTYLISTIFRKQQMFFQPYGSFFRKMLRCFDHIFVQDVASQQLLNTIRITDVSIAGDTRIDRVMEIARSEIHFPEVVQFTGESKIFIWGSTHHKDEKLLCDFLKQIFPPDWKIVIAPHEIQENHIVQLQTQLPCSSTRLSTFSLYENPRVLIIDCIGMLSRLYRYGHLAYIGGGFDSGIHNTLEPIAFGIPVIFGPAYAKFKEAGDLIHAGGAFSVYNTVQLIQCFNDLCKKDLYSSACQQARQYIQENKGGTEIIFDKLRRVV